MTDDNVVDLKGKKASKEKRSKEKRIESADGIDDMVRGIFEKAGASPSAEAVKYQIAQSAALIRGAYAPMADMIGRMADTINEMIKINNRMVDNQNRMVAAVETLAENFSALDYQVDGLKVRIEQLAEETGAVGDHLHEQKYDLIE